MSVQEGKSTKDTNGHEEKDDISNVEGRMTERNHE